MTSEQLRDLYVRDIDDALDSWVLMRRLSEEQKRRLRTARRWYMAGCPDGLAGLNRMYEQEPPRAGGAEAPYPTHCPKCEGGADVLACLVCRDQKVCGYVEPLGEPAGKGGAA